MTEKPETESLQVQLTELNNRSRWYSAELWQIPFAYLGLTGLIIVQIANKKPEFLGYTLISAAVFGIFVIIHMCKIRKNEIRAVKHLQKTEAELYLSPTTKLGSGLKIFQITIILAVFVYAIFGLYLSLKENRDKPTIQHSAVGETKSSKEESTTRIVHDVEKNKKTANKSMH